MEILIVPFVLVNLWGVHINPYEVVSLYGDQRTCTLSLRNSHQWTVTPTPEEGDLDSGLDPCERVYDRLLASVTEE
jgi:hypothetical protein